jgi:hypothetical protein
LMGRLLRGLSRRIEAKGQGALQARLDKHPAPKAALGPKDQGTAKPWIRRRSNEYCKRHDPAPAFVWFVWFVVKKDPPPDLPRAPREETIPLAAAAPAFSNASCKRLLSGRSDSLHSPSDCSWRQGRLPTMHLASRSAVSSHLIPAKEKTPPCGGARAGDRIRTDDVQLGKLAFYH